MAHYREDWYSCLDFKFEDAAQQRDRYTDDDGKDITHIYSYNKVMSIPDRRDISKILNRTNFKLMAWYFGPRDSAASGLKRFRLAFKMPMQSTGKQKFTVYVYYKTELYNSEDPWSEDDSEAEQDSSEEEEKTKCIIEISKS